MNKKLLRIFNNVETKHWWWQGRRQFIKQNLETLKIKRVLDVGCGTGQTLLFVSKLFPEAELYGVDNHPLSVKFAKDNGLKNIRRASAKKLPYKDNFFDVILFLDVLEHIEDDLSAVKEAKRVLRRGGVIIISSPALQFIWSEHDSQQGHFRRYTRRMTRALARENGLKTKSVSYFNFFLSPVIITVRLLSRLKPTRGLGDYDSKFNYDVVNNLWLNRLLEIIFVSEVKLLKIINYPIGISVGAVFQKK